MCPHATSILHILFVLILLFMQRAFKKRGQAVYDTYYIYIYTYIYIYIYTMYYIYKYYIYTYTYYIYIYYIYIHIHIIYIYMYIYTCNGHSAIFYTYYMCPHTSISVYIIVGYSKVDTRISINIIEV
jgi:hypothetical protein